jgi:hypothetical protein
MPSGRRSRAWRQLTAQLDYNLLYRWFVGLNMDDPIWDVSVFHEAFFDAVPAQARGRQLLSPHLARNTTNRRSAIDARTTRHSGYALSQRARNLTGASDFEAPSSRSR